MALGGTVRNDETGGDRSVGQSLGYKVGDLPFTFCQVCRDTGGRRRDPGRLAQGINNGTLNSERPPFPDGLKGALTECMANPALVRLMVDEEVGEHHRRAAHGVPQFLGGAH